MSSDSTATAFKFVNQGGYGCVFQPEIVCDTNQLGSTDYISKIYRNEDIDSADIHKEEQISNMIRKVPNFNSFFVPILTTCNVDIANYKNNFINEVKQCDIFYENTPQDNNRDSEELREQNMYVSAKMRYISNTLKNEMKFLVNQTVETDFVRKMTQTYNHIDLALQKCIQAGFIHYDVKLENILYDSKIHSPVLIDYGISVVIEKLLKGAETMDLHELQNIFYTKKYYPYWCIDIFMISQFLHHDYDDSKNITNKNEYLAQPTTTVTQTFVDNTIKMYMEQFKEIFPNEEIQAGMHKHYYEFFAQFVNKSWHEIVKACVSQKWYETWDYFSLCVTYLDLYEVLAKERKYIKTSTGVTNLMKKCLNGIVSDPLHRRITDMD